MPVAHPPPAVRLPDGIEARPARPGDLEAVVALCVRWDVADLGCRTPTWTTSAPCGGAPATTWTGTRCWWWPATGRSPTGTCSRARGSGRSTRTGGAGGSGLAGPPDRELAGDGSTLEVSAPAGDHAYRELVERAGYRRGRSNWLMRLDMDGPPPPPAWPDGVGMRTFDRAVDARAVHRLVEDAFADIGNQPPRSYEFWVEVHLERSDFDPALWFLAVDDGELAGVNLAQSGPLGGYVVQLAVRRDQRGRGLGLALLRHGFGELYRRGVGEVVLDVDSHNRTGATRLYERAGMRVQHQYDHWVRDPP